MLVAASKSRTIAEIGELASLGHRHFGENYVSDAQPKIRQLADRQLVWHFIGTIQSNKTRQIAQHFDWVQSIDSARIGRRLNDAREHHSCSDPLNICIQVNVDNEPQKSGVNMHQVAELLNSLQSLPQLRVRGLMAIPKAVSEPESSRKAFSTLYEVFERLRPAASEHWDTVSMGMSSDYAIAIQEGASMVRIGTDIFGPRS